MIIKVGTQYLDFNGDIETEKQANLFEDISEVNGDFSYSFELEDTANNRYILGIQNINTVANFAQKIDCVLLSDSGEDLHYGYLRVESITDVISCSFFGGNNNWFVLTDTPIRQFNFRKFDKDFSYGNVVGSHTLSNGIVWPLIDRGTLNQRDTATVYDNDWQPFIYVKDVIRTVLNQEGIKLAGDILKDPIYNSLITTNNGLSGVQQQLDTVAVYASKTSNQTISSGTYADVSFQDTTTSPNFEGSDNNWTTPNYTVTKDLITLDIELNLIIESASAGIGQIKLTVDGVAVFTKTVGAALSNTRTFNFKTTLSDIYSGSVIKLEAKVIANTYTINTNSTIKFTPVKLRKVYGSQLLPDLNASEYIASIFSRLNCFVSYDSKTQTINTKFLDNIIKETPIDLSEYIESFDQDNTSIVDEYARSTRFLYQESGEDNINQYNSISEIPYGGGEIVIDNDFIEEETDFIELEEIAPYQIPVNWLGFSLPLVEYSEYAAEDSYRFTDVNSSSNFAEFEVSISADIETGDLIRVTISTDESYIGIFRVTSTSSLLGKLYLVTDAPYSASATGELEVVTTADNINEDQVILLNSPSTDLTEFTDTPSIVWRRTSNNTLTSIALGYFWLPQVNKPINTLGKALYFDKVNDPQAYQIGLIDAYFRTAERILNNPVVLTAVMYLPVSVFRSIDFLSPVRIETKDFTSNFLVNRITGYKGQEYPCEVELIKIS